MDSDKLTMAAPLDHFKVGATALLVVDKQFAYMDPVTLDSRGYSLTDMGRQGFANMELLIAAARSAGVPVIWTQMFESVSSPATPISEKIAQDIAAGYTVIDSVPGNADYAIFGAVQPLDGEVIIEKTHYDSFSNPALAKTFHDLGIDSVVITGGFASRCVLGTAFGANSNDLHVLVVNDAVIDPAGFEPEIPVTTKIINAIIGFHTSTAEIMQIWQQKDLV
jgi:nicotinamidase-related amidase